MKPACLPMALALCALALPRPIAAQTPGGLVVAICGGGTMVIPLDGGPPRHQRDDRGSGCHACALCRRGGGEEQDGDSGGDD